MLNKIVVEGRITHTPELRHTSTGTAVLNVNLAVGRSRKDANGEYPTDYFDVVLWGKTAEVVAEKYGKGDLLIVYGRMETRKYQDKQGNNRTAWELQADGYEYSGVKPTGGSATAAAAPADPIDDPAASSDVPF